MILSNCSLLACLSASRAPCVSATTSLFWLSMVDATASKLAPEVLATTVVKNLKSFIVASKFSLMTSVGVGVHWTTGSFGIISSFFGCSSGK